MSDLELYCKDIYETLESELKKNSNIDCLQVKYMIDIFECHNNSSVFGKNELGNNARQRLFDFLTDILKIFIAYRSRDTRAITSILHRFFNRCYGSHSCPRSTTLFISRYPFQNYPEVIWAENCHLILSLPHDTAHHTFSYCEDLVRHAGVCGNTGLLYLLQFFGATLLRPHDDEDEWKGIIAVMKMLFRKQLYRFPDEYFEETRMELSSTSRQRLFLIRRGLEIFAKAHRGFWPVAKLRYEEYKRCFNMLFSSIPDPLITAGEILNFLTKVLRGAVPDESVFQMLSEFETFAPECRKPSSPRSLQHLSRFRVRECLRSSKNLPHGVQSLGIPTLMKDFIQLKENFVSNNKKPIMLNIPELNPKIYLFYGNWEKYSNHVDTVIAYLEDF